MKPIRTLSLFMLSGLLSFHQVVMFPSLADAANLQQRVPQQQKQLLDKLPEKSETKKESALPKFKEPASEAQHHQQAQILYRYLRKVRGLDHEQAMDELRGAEFPTSRIKEF